MNKFLGSLAFILMLSNTCAGVPKGNIRIAIGEWTPFYSESYKHYGVVPHIISEAFLKVNIKVEYGFFPWARGLKLAKDGHWDASGCWSEMTESRKKDFIFSEGVFSEKIVFFHLKDFSFRWKSVSDLNELDIGTTLGYLYGKPFDKAKKNGDLSVSESPSDEQNFKKLLAGRIHIFPIDQATGYFMIHQLILAQLQRLCVSINL